jgi:hypothetical protein
LTFDAGGERSGGVGALEDRVHAFEQDNPDTFQSMYVFWVQKPADHLR